jgi:hypothetical protein
VQPFRKFTAILRNPKVHHRVQKIPPLVPIRSQIDPANAIPSYLFKIDILVVVVVVVVIIIKIKIMLYNLKVETNHITV